MAVVNRKNIEKMLCNIDEEFLTYGNERKLEILQNLERKNNLYNGERLSEYELMRMAIEKIEYDFAHIYCEGKAKSTITRLNKLIKEIKNEVEMKSNYKDEETYNEVLKDLITYVQIVMNLDITFSCSLLRLHKIHLEQEQEKQLSQTTIKCRRRSK